MRAGDLRHRITLQSPAEARAEFGDMVTTWTDEATVWGAVEWGTGRRYAEAKQFNTEVGGVVRIRYRPDIEATWRIKYGERYFKIISLSNTGERGRELVMSIKEAED